MAASGTADPARPQGPITGEIASEEEDAEQNGRSGGDAGAYR